MLRIPLDWFSTIAMLILTLVLCSQWSMQVAFNPANYIQVLLFVTALSFTAALILVVASYLTDAISDRKREQGDSRRNFYIALTRTLTLLLLMSWIYSHIKTGVLLGVTYDDQLRSFDRFILGNDGWTLARQVIPIRLGIWLSTIYMLFKPLIVTAILFLLFIGQTSQSRKLTTGILVGYFVGVLMYFAIPTYGPAFVYESASCEHLEAQTHEIQMVLSKATAEVHRDPSQVNVLPWKYIAAFPSLHLSHVIILSWFLRKRPIAFPLSILFVVLTAIATIYLGWHYLADLLGGVGVAIAAIWITERFSVIRISLPRELPFATPWRRLAGHP